MVSIRSVTPQSGRRLEVLFDNGHSVTLDFTSRLRTVRFGRFKDEEFFKQAATDGDFVRWNRLIEISANEVFQLAQKEWNVNVEKHA
ncbi:DUF2442 domain-containing protein [Pelotomaculum terephthalicicum JT]|uniref:DUF2442 domain-containing protein n=1 Tax=Pelotomaculum TaxID=191373 RepID=UPI0009CD9309|nr:MULTISPECIES: DUF2442 domain-containing protein [Pelotomaculum]MCG9966711.1 DUF2442 domain-containing protein [Pelotomaculum terephthalicicum JT]OPX91430.1 MAG: hypothetical protein A4E54_00255 [Pelotomaculum sp. PtaB.Bin117]OPY62966.1 MAG: hypothetical protein A4E56_00922 [Pelotomaculum sp. PtaU1.Bin065]